jgi:hypothetical protein
MIPTHGKMIPTHGFLPEGVWIIAQDKRSAVLGEVNIGFTVP